MRAAETAVTFARISNDDNINWGKLYQQLQDAREQVGLNQHHDAITGTCRTHVAQDYHARLDRAVENTQNIEKQMLNIILGKTGDETFKQVENFIISSPGTFGLIIRNYESHTRTQYLKIKSSTSQLKIFDNQDKLVSYQVVPVIFSKDGTLKNEVNEYEIYFKVTINGFSIKKYRVEALSIAKKRKRSNNHLYLTSGTQSYKVSSKNIY